MMRSCRPQGIFGALATVMLAAILLAVLFLVIGHPALVSWWRAEYLFSGFAALLVGVAIRAIRAQKSSATLEEAPMRRTVVAFFKSIGVVFGAILLLLMAYLFVMY